MKKFSINKHRILIGFLVLLVMGMWAIYENWPIVQSEEKIRKEMLCKFPIGTKKETVWGYANKVNPGLDGATKRNVGWWLNNDQSSDKEIGSSRVLASISSIGIIDVTVIWLFDENDKLIEIYAWKTWDMP